MIYSPKQLANQLLLIRTKNNWTQQDIAAKAGVKQATISNFENDPERCQLQTVFKIMQALQVHMQVSDTALNTMSDEDSW
ncbi:MAG: transcriptional regulator [Alteromonadaceae bacterium]|jgi:HTH-type transcriptional regulator/antitoxin HipB|uniref:Type II toxin-antitoxin system antitoxin HipB n=1 Tax=Paraglaciecola mesophila TaxID=197222 RepID=A0ABU9SZU9_9ALTE|nr:transcriptional regulator [Alteromonadaceae bacterium]MBB20517.1 transcriptional regulator [Rickettsiales bacterium]|tara:strand:+ start:5463 stop:5702 length:240 start_codon:yes stop_codon:yes gene_type:complete